MRVRATASSLLIAILLCLSATVPTSAQQQKEWKGAYADGRPMSRADLDKILERHKLWVESGGKSGSLAALSDADLSGAILVSTDLQGAFLSSAKLREANLIGADLIGADLSGADLTGAQLASAFLEGANLRGAILRGAHLDGDDLSGADLANAVLPGADLSHADLSHAYLHEADLSGADLFNANLSRADLRLSGLSGANLSGANLARAVFEPKNLPILEGIAEARGLELMSYGDNPGPLAQLRKQFQDAGYREPERAITCALNRREAELDPFVEHWFKRIAFDITCAYGFRPGRPLRIVGVLWILFSVVYFAFMHVRGKSGIYLEGTRWSRGQLNVRRLQIRSEPIRPIKSWKLAFHWLRREWRVLRTAMFFSLMSAFNIGFRDINFGRWLRLLTKREYDLKAVGWARTVSGFQSLLSVYLIALWVLAYFGRPFG
jgi:uncharacterized protein YjbI with pentapeptide repeats